MYVYGNIIIITEVYIKFKYCTYILIIYYALYIQTYMEYDTSTVCIIKIASHGACMCVLCAGTCIVQLCVCVCVCVCVQVGECTCGDCVTNVRAFTFASPLHTWQELLVPAHLALCALSWHEEGKRRVSECGWVYTAGLQCLQTSMPATANQLLLHG